MNDFNSHPADNAFFEPADEEEIDVNIVTSDKTVSGIFTDLFGYLEKHKTSRFNPSVATVHHDLEDDDKWYDWNNYSGNYELVDKIICLNSNQKKFLIEHGTPEEKLEVIAHGYNAKLLKPKKTHPFLESGKLTIGVASRRYGRRVKGDAYMFELSKRLDPDIVQFVLVGEGRGITAVELVNLGFDVKCFEYLPYNIIQSFYNDIDLLLMCSEFEGGPANIPECLATGTPLVCSNVGMVTDQVIDGENGQILSGNMSFDSERIMELVVNDGEKLVEAGKKVVAMKDKIITWEENVSKHIELYSSLVTS